MNNTVYFDTFDIANLNRCNEYVFEVGLFAESLLINEKTIISAFKLKKTIKFMCEMFGEKKTASLFKKGIITIQWESIDFQMAELHQNTNKICKVDLLDTGKIDIEKEIYDMLIELGLEKVHRKRLQSAMCDNSKILTIANVEQDKMYELFENILNNEDELYKILKTNKPYHYDLDIWKEKQCDIKIDNKTLFIENTKDLSTENIKFLSGIIGGYYLPIVYRMFMSQTVALNSQCDSIWGNINIRNFQTKYINNLVGDKLSGNFEQLLYAFNCPNVALAVENGTISGNDILLYRDKMRYFREFLYDNKEYDGIELLRKYNEAISKENDKTHLWKFGMKTIWFTLGCISPLFAFVDTYLKDPVKNTVIKKMNKPITIRIDEIIVKK